MANKTHWKKVVSDPNFIGEADFEPGEEKILTIASINKSETVVTQEGKSNKAVVHWTEKDAKPMILNVARSKSIEKVAKSGYFEDWIGVKVQLYIEHGIKAFGDVVSAVRVRPYAPKIKNEAPIICEVCGNAIQAAYGMSAVDFAKYTKANVGKAVCKKCANDIAAAAKADSAEQASVDTDSVE